MELREQFPTMTDVQQLEHKGFSSEQIAGLLRVKAFYQRGIYHEDESVNAQDCCTGVGGRGKWRVSGYQPGFGNRRVGRETSKQDHAE